MRTEFWVQLLALKCEWVEALWKQNAILAQEIQAMDDNHWVLAIILIAMGYKTLEPLARHLDR